MTAVLDIITDAYRETNLIGKGVVPDADEQSAGLKRLQALLSGTAGFEIGEELVDWPIGVDNIDPIPPFYQIWNQEIWMHPMPNSRLVMNSSIAQTVWFTAQPDDGARMALIDPNGGLPTYPLTIEGNGRLIDGQKSLIVNSDADLPHIWFYRADLGQWITVTPIALDGDMPFPVDFDDFWITMLAMRLNPRYGRAMSAESTAWLSNMSGAIQARYRQKITKPAPIGVLNMSTQAYNAWTNRGRAWGGNWGWPR